MLSVYTPYVGRFARDWHRLSTTDHSQPSPILGTRGLGVQERVTARC